MTELSARRLHFVLSGSGGTGVDGDLSLHGLVARSTGAGVLSDGSAEDILSGSESLSVRFSSLECDGWNSMLRRLNWQHGEEVA